AFSGLERRTLSRWFLGFGSRICRKRTGCCHTNPASEVAWGGIPSNYKVPGPRRDGRSRKRDPVGKWRKNRSRHGCDGRWGVDPVRVAIHPQFFSRQRAAGISSQTRKARPFHAGTFSNFRRRYFDYRLLRFSTQSRRRGENRKSWVRTRDVAGFSRARGDEGGGKQNAPIFVRLISGAGGCANRIHAHLLVLRYP